ncbi:helix-turn-helix domain-containing protein [Macrococcoides canis]|uniref:helix-turn-helix domain-containing protein n=1 Tax=Macrococcoides canis TaxID=1855823 RepID=UPI001CAA84B0|nr:helix-turn-helix transcriptional regulator [Macrococcus canis]
MLDRSDTLSNLVGKRIRNSRIKKGISQKELAEKINVSNAVMSRYESGTRSPDFEKLKHIAEVLEVSIDYLLDHEKTTTETFLLNSSEGFSDLPIDEQNRIEKTLREHALFLISQAKKNNN